MAIARPGPLLTALSGTIGGVTFKNTRRGCVVTSAPRPLRKQSELLLETQARWSNLRRTWYELTDQERLNWNTAAANYLRPDRLGVPRTISGLQLFMRHWTLTSPAFGLDYGTPPNAGTAPAPASFVLSTFTSSAIVCTITMPTGYSVFDFLIYGRRMFTTGAFTPPPVMQRVAYGYAASSPRTWDITAQFHALFGAPEAGEGICVRTQIQTPYAWTSPLSAAAIAYRA